MKKVNLINVPKEIEYISDWSDFEYPQGHLILDKTICGCGFTEYCITNNIPLILCSPRKTLLQNKKKQHLETNVYYFKNECTAEVYDTEVAEKNNEEKQEYMIQLKDDLNSWLRDMRLQKHVPKILVTYDSLHHVLDVLGESKNNFAIVVDEFQAVFLDAAFKADIEFDFIEDLKGCRNVLYLSATPMLEKYLDDLDYFKDLDFYKLRWDSSRVESVRIERKITRNPASVLAEFIKNYREGVYPSKSVNGEMKYSKELVIFVNSVKSICDIIKHNKLLPEETNIICSDTSDNRKKLGKLKHEIGEAPLEGEDHKMFTLCTRTTYLGSDFYSPSAYTIIISDCNIKTLTVDISLDLPQIVGRQRLKENVFKNEVLFLYKAGTIKDATINLSVEDFDSYMKGKIEKTNTLLVGYSKMSEEEKQEWTIKASQDKELYQNDFLGVSKRSGKVVFNNLVKIANQRAYDVSRKDYQDQVTIKRCMENSGLGVIVIDEEQNNELVERFLLTFKSTGVFIEKMKLLCEFVELYPQYYESCKNQLPREFEIYIEQLGISIIRSQGCEEARLKKIINSERKLTNNRDIIISLFKIGETYSRVKIKEILGIFYQTQGIQKTPKASDLENYFELKEVQFTNKETGKRDRAYKILRLKE